VSHPSEWVHGGYPEIEYSPLRYCPIDREKLIELGGMESNQQLVRDYHSWIELAAQNNHLDRQQKWSEAVCVGSEGFVKH